MDTKVILFLALFSAVFVQENSANPLSIPTLSDILGHVKGSIEALVKDAEEKTQQESADASALLAELQASSQDRIADAQAEALQLTSGLPEKIIAEVAKAGGSPDKILECTKQAQADIDKYGSDAQMALTACVTDKLGEAVMAVTAAVEASQMTANILTDMQSEIQTMCPITNSSDSENTFVQSLCSQNLITAASDKVAEQGEVTASKMKEASDIVKGMSVVQPDLATCFKTKAAEVAAGAQPIIEKIVVCASAAPAMPAAPADVPAVPAPGDAPAVPADVPEAPADVPAVPSPDDVPAAPSPDDVPAAPSPDDDPAVPSPDDVPAAPSLFDM